VRIFHARSVFYGGPDLILDYTHRAILNSDVVYIVVLITFNRHKSLCDYFFLSTGAVPSVNCGSNPEAGARQTNINSRGLGK
jgi:hypothetical protein